MPIYLQPQDVHHIDSFSLWMELVLAGSVFFWLSRLQRGSALRAATNPDLSNTLGR